MKTKNKIIAFGLIGVLIGGFLGFFLAGRLTKKRIHQKVEMQRPPMFKNRLEEILELDDQQQMVYDSVFHSHMNRMRAIEDSVHVLRKAEFERLFTELKTGLSEEQVQKLDKFSNRMKKRGPRRNNERPRRKRE